MLSQQDQEMRQNVPDPSFADGSHLCGSGAGTETSCTVYLEIFARRNFRELPAELNFRVFIFANGDLTIYIVYIANDLY